jgi:hypothetical protein
MTIFNVLVEVGPHKRALTEDGEESESTLLGKSPLQRPLLCHYNAHYNVHYNAHC